MPSLLRIGDRVILDEQHEDYENNAISVGPSNIGTITDVVSTSYYVIEWDEEGPHTYEDGDNVNQYNISIDEVVLHERPPVLTKQELICKKIRYLDEKFKRRKLSHDF